MIFRICFLILSLAKPAMNKFFILPIALACLLPVSDSKFLILADENSEPWIGAFRLGSSEFDDMSGGNSFEFKAVSYLNESNWDEVCQYISSGVSAVLDLTHLIDTDFKPRQFFVSKFIPYFKIEVPTDSLIKGANALMEAKSATNGFLIFHQDNDVGRAIHQILGNTLIRYAFLNAATMGKLIVEKFEYRIPSGVLVFGNSIELQTFVKERGSVVRDLTDWIFSFDSIQTKVQELNVSFPYIRGYFEENFCCKLLSRPLMAVTTTSTPETNKTTPPTYCSPADCFGDPAELYLKKLALIFSTTLRELGGTVVKVGCNSTDLSKGDPKFFADFAKNLEEKADGLYFLQNEEILLNATITYDEFANKSSKPVGLYSHSTGFVHSPDHQFRKRLPYYRIGIVDLDSKPWTFRDPVTGEWIGYCIDLTKEIARRMNFTYDFVVSKSYGNRNNVTGRWDGLTGDLVHGKCDIAISAYIMTSEREEYIDFVSPYFEQSGLIITMQRPIVKNSLFKFMTVLRPEVWFSIAGATIATGFMLWFLDKFSPYSAQNNPHKYKHFRKFTLKESFWFALTSFTPQGGGEPPKAFSGRTLVAAYWIFVVLMLATFTANLAAFLTVERMQSPIRNLEHLAGQSSVKYSVVDDSTANRFFKNMANAEELLYQMWRNLTLSAPSSDKQYIVWEYPIREMYIHINSVIEKTGYVTNYTDGLERAAADQYYAFIHDAAQTKYEVYRNCNLTLIGEPFAESPYAIAVAQGNPLQDNISMTILELQTERFFEKLSTKYWSPQCQAAGEGEGDGISLESLGGVFIATIIGLGIAFVSLAFEVFTTARARKKAKVEAELIKPKYIVPMDFYGTSKKFEKQKSNTGLNFLPEVIN